LSGVSDFEATFSKYLDDVKKATLEEPKAFLFLEFVRKTFSGVTSDFIENLYPVLQKHLRRGRTSVALAGRPDAMLGNLIIEFKQDLSKQLSEAESQLRLYASILWTNQGVNRVNYQLMACDGTKIHVYRPVTSVPLGGVLDPKDVRLEEIDSIDLAKERSAEHAFVWLDRYILFRSKLPPTGEVFAERFGGDSPPFKEAFYLLKEAWRDSQQSGGVMYEEWGRYLRYVYGEEVASEDLFLRHTYLATLAKLVVYSYYSPGVTGREDLIEVLQGSAFRRLNILNFLEEDFFSWVGRPESEEYGIRVAALISDVLRTFELSAIREDILKELYQQLVDPSERHDLGEYYTPEWLAQMIVGQALKGNAKRRVLDPAAGSGTFLVSALHHKQEKLNKMGPDELLTHLETSVVGLDIHPLAVIIAKANYLLAVKDLIKRRKGAFSLPVYMANSIVLPAEVQEYAVDPAVKSYVREVKTPTARVALRIPTAVAEDPAVIDLAITAVRNFAQSVGDPKTASKTVFQNALESLAPGVRELPKYGVIVDVLFNTALGMKQLADEGRDTIWAFILRNIYRPLFLSSKANRFDRLVGNPPWLSFRYIADVDYQNEVKTLIMKYGIYPEASLVTQMELATLFLLRTADLYLKDSGRISFVMPRSIFSADQHDRFRRRTRVVSLKSLLDLEAVSPLFNVPCCVVYAGKSGVTKYPLPGIIYDGELPSRNASLETASKVLGKKNTHFVLCEVGERSFLMEGKRPLKFVGKSDYFGRFTQGATIVPRSCWFVDPSPDPSLGLDPTFPYVVTSEKAISLAKSDYSDVRMKGNVEARFLYSVATGSELVPFATTTLPMAVLPIEPSALGFKMVTGAQAAATGCSGLAAWLSDVEKIWKTKRGEKAARMDIYSRLDYSNTLTRQRPRAKYKVLYNAAGTNLCAAVLNQRRRIIKKVGGQELKLNGIVAEHKVYRMETDDEGEAYYVAAVLNSGPLDRLVKPMQSRGQFGERDIEKKPLEFPIPKYDPKNRTHQRLAELGKECASKAEKTVPDLEKKYSSLGKIRGEIRAVIREELRQIDELTLKLLSKNERVLDYFS
jgi:hypothetical protein